MNPLITLVQLLLQTELTPYGLENMKTILNYEYREPFDIEDCEDCAHNKGKEVVACSNTNATYYIMHNLKCEEYEQEDNSDDS